MAPKNDHFLRIKAAAGSEKGSSQNPFNYMKSTIHGEHDRSIKILKFKHHRVRTDSFSEARGVKKLDFNHFVSYLFR